MQRLLKGPHGPVEIAKWREATWNIDGKTQPASYLTVGTQTVRVAKVGDKHWFAFVVAGHLSELVRAGVGYVPGGQLLAAKSFSELVRAGVGYVPGGQLLAAKSRTAAQRETVEILRKTLRRALKELPKARR